MKSEEKPEANDALCQVYAFQLQRRRLRLAQETQLTTQAQQQAPSLEEKKNAVPEEQAPQSEENQAFQ